MKLLIRNAYIAAFLLISFGNATAQTNANETLIGYDTPWKILNSNTAVSADWSQTSFNDKNWKTIATTEMGSGLVYQDVEGKVSLTEAAEEVMEEAIFKPSYGAGRYNRIATTYFRKDIELANPAEFGKIIVNFRRDEGIVMYVNGVEVLRDNMPEGTIGYNTLAATESSANRYDVHKAELNANVFKAGKNIVAVEIHKHNLKNKYNNFNLEVIGLRAAAAPVITRGPFLQIPTDKNIFVRWQTQAASDARVMYGTDAKNLNQFVINSDASVTDHILRLDELKPNTKYYYNIGSSTEISQYDSTLNWFYSAPVAGSGQKRTFWAIGDYGVNTGNTNELKMRNAFYSYMGNKHVDGWFTMGDNAYLSGLNTEFQSWVFDVFGPKRLKNTPFWPSPGNHDYNNNPADQTTHNVPYFTNFTLPTKAEAGGVASGVEYYYSYNVGNIHFLALDAYGLDANKRMSDTTGPQCAWIKKDLEANKLPWVVAYWHHPPYSKGSHDSDAGGAELELQDIRTKFLPFLEKYNVDLVLNGHSHSYERSYLIKGFYDKSEMFDKTKHAVSASTGMYDGSPNSAPYIKAETQKGTGTVYIVGGSSGQLGGKSPGYPHKAMVFSNENIPGSTIITVEDTRLDVQWLGGDTIIHDNFTMFKGVNKHFFHSIVKGESITLTASWPGKHVWSTGDTTRSITVTPLAEGDYTVTDVLGHLADTNTVTFKTASVSVNNTASEVAVELYPNPATNNGTMLSIVGATDDEVDVTIANVIGQNIVLNKTIKLTNGAAKEWLSISGKGNYIVTIKGENTNISRKIEVL